MKKPRFEEWLLTKQRTGGVIADLAIAYCEASWPQRLTKSHLIEYHACEHTLNALNEAKKCYKEEWGKM